jgi:hypothetical protein
VCVAFLSLFLNWVQGVCLVNQGGVQKVTPQVTPYEPHTSEESLRRLINGHSQSITDCTNAVVLILYSSWCRLLIHCNHVFWTWWISYRIPRIIFSKRKVTSPDQELNTILPSSFVLDYINKVVFFLTAFSTPFFPWTYEMPRKVHFSHRSEYESCNFLKQRYCTDNRTPIHFLTYSLFDLQMSSSVNLFHYRRSFLLTSQLKKKLDTSSALVEVSSIAY